MIKQVSTMATISVLLLGACDSGGSSPEVAATHCGDREEISAILKCPTPGAKGVSEKVSTATMYLASPGFDSMADCDLNKLGPICTTLVMTSITCTWENMTLGGQELTESLWHGQGYMQGNVAVAEEGYDSGLLASGDRYLSRWTEFQVPGRTIAVWKPVFGTGKLAGISGEAVLECPPSDGSSVETCTVRGCYSLPEAD